MTQCHFGFLAIDLDPFRYWDSLFHSDIILAVERRTSSSPQTVAKYNKSYGTWHWVALNRKFDLAIQVCLIFFLGQAPWNWQSCAAELGDSHLLQFQNLFAFLSGQLSLVLSDLLTQPRAATFDSQPSTPSGRLFRKYGWSSHQTAGGIRQHLERIALGQRMLALSQTMRARCTSDQGCRSTARIGRNMKGLKASDSLDPWSATGVCRHQRLP